MDNSLYICQNLIKNNLTINLYEKTVTFFVGHVASVCTTAGAATFTIDDKVYDYDCLIKKEIGPGVTYHRLRIPDYPLNINYITVDLNNPYNKIETFQGQNVVGKTEKLANVYAREVEAGRKPLGGQNSNFWVVATRYSL